MIAGEDRAAFEGERSMPFPRSVLSVPTVFAAVLAAGWYASAVLPLVSAASAGEQTAVTAASTEPASGRQDATKPITPENPIPRRVSSVPIPYPLQLRGSGYHAAVTLRVTVDSSGSVAETSIAHLERGSATAPTPTPSATDVQAFVAAATDAIKQWRYEL